MRLEEEFVGRSAQFAELLRSIAERLDNGSFAVRGKPLSLPDQDLEYKITLKTDLGAAKLTIGIEWLEP
jgi:amphi-Trp domain-containing protein